MPQPGLGEAHIRLARHPDHSSAVTATLAGPESSRNLARTALSNRGFRWIDLKTLVLARIDHEEPYYADQAARALRDVGATVEIAPSLQEEIDTEWTYGNYPMPYLDRDEIREVSAEAQRIHDDIASGRLTIHLHAHDGWTTVAVGTYRNGKSVHFHGEDYLRQETADYETEAEAVADFHSQYAVAVRPGPAPSPTSSAPPLNSSPHRPPRRLSPHRPSAPSPPSQSRRRCPYTPLTPAIMKTFLTRSSNHRTSGRRCGPGPTAPPSPTTNR